MERYNDDWQDRHENRRGDARRSDNDHHRGAYRLDEEGDYSTYNRSNRSHQGNNSRYSDLGNRGPYGNNENQGGDYIYRRSRNQQDNDDYTRHQQQDSYRGGSANQRGYSSGNPDRHSSQGRPPYDGGRQAQGGNAQRYDEDYSRRTAGNFDADYHPDSYGRGRGENYGNMAGSLSYGYDGGRNSDPDYNRRYNPMTGEIRQRRHEDDDRQRQPRRYGPPDRTGSNPDYDRY